ncbi:MAG: pyruvate, orthophosphate dikinase [Actinomycetota bacterium]|nr:pyruvate, orthophosphate dikinase [Actinomycetota bacterium]
MAAPRLIYRFDEADPDNAILFGGKGAGLARMTVGGLPVPPGFVITTEACRRFTEDGRLPDGLVRGALDHLADQEAATGRTFGGGPKPLLVSVRSGAPVSMPGMMDTVLNLGLNEAAALALAQATGSTRFMADVYARFHRMYSDIVLRADGDAIAAAATPVLAGIEADTDPAAAFAHLHDALVRVEHDDVGTSVPDDPTLQLEQAIRAVFESWNSRRAVTYRKVHGIPDSLGTAVVVQTMVFGNLGSPSGSGVAFTRNPSTGEPELYGEFLEGGQGEDVVAGTVTPQPIAVAAVRHPDLFAQLEQLCTHLEELYRDVLDIEYTVEQGTLYLLQVRSAKRTAQAAVRIAADLYRKGWLEPAEALAQVTADHLRQSERPRFDEDAVAGARLAGRVLATGVGASPGHVSGKVVLDPDRAVALAEAGDAILLARPTTSPLDLHGMLASVGIITAMGGATSHAAVVARALGKPCVVGCAALDIDPAARRLSVNGSSYDEGSVLSIDGASGEIFLGDLPSSEGRAEGADIDTVLAVARQSAGCLIYGIATTPAQVEAVIGRGAAGIATRVSEVLATTGRFEELLAQLVAARPGTPLDLGGFEQVIADVMTPLFVAAGDAEIAVRAVDLVSEDHVEILETPRMLTALPRAGLPIGVPELLRVQIAGLAIAAHRAELRRPPELTVRHVSDPGEVAELRRLAAEETDGPGRAPILIGATLTSPRGVQMAPELAPLSDFLWLDVRRLQAAAFGYPASLFLTGEPLDDYVRRGMLAIDPRQQADGPMAQLLASLSVTRISTPQCRLGVRLAGPVSEGLGAAFYRAGFRNFAIDAEEIRVADLALGKAALADTNGR